MTDEQELQADQVARALVATMNELVHVHGISPQMVVCAVHGTIMAEITQACGGDVAADMARKAADRVEGIPALATCELATMEVRGTA
jgi:hypothetical protein